MRSEEKPTLAQLTNAIVHASEELEKAEEDEREASRRATNALNSRNEARRNLAAAKKALDERIDPKTKG